MKLSRCRIEGCLSRNSVVKVARLSRSQMHAPNSTRLVDSKLSMPQRQSILVQSSSSATSDSSPHEAPSSMAWDQRHPGDEGIDSLQSLIASIPFRRLAIWSSMAFLAYSLQDFTGLVVGTFIISFIGNSFVDSCLSVTNSRTSRHTFPFLHELFPPPMRRRALTVVYFTAILSVFCIVGVLTIPDIANEGEQEPWQGLQHADFDSLSSQCLLAFSYIRGRFRPTTPV